METGHQRRDKLNFVVATCRWFVVVRRRDVQKGSVCSRAKAMTGKSVIVMSLPALP